MRYLVSGAVALLLATSALSFAGCGSDEESPNVGSSLAGAAGSASTTVGASGFAGGNIAGAPAVYTVDNFCSLIPSKLCANYEPCCRESSIPYNQATCEENEKIDCEKEVADVRAGNVVFSPDKVDACLAFVQSFYKDSCRASELSFFKSPAALANCALAFTGKLSLGARCERDGQCALPNASSVVRCGSSASGATKTCQLVASFAAVGEVCRASKQGLIFCQEGLSCRPTKVAPQDVEGTCIAKLSVDDSCTASGECGLPDAYCLNNKCAKTRAIGEPCVANVQCWSNLCGADKKCQPAEPNITASTCAGKDE